MQDNIDKIVEEYSKEELCASQWDWLCEVLARLFRALTSSTRESARWWSR